MTSTPAPNADLALALRMADAADAISMSRFQAHDLVVHTKPDQTPVTEADQAVERALRDLLASERAGDGIVGEEYGDDGEAVRKWILDPIDGTKNYVRGVPVWATLIALLEQGELTVGVVSAPALARRWWAARGTGAFVREPGRSEPRRLRVSGVSGLADASLSISDERGWVERGAGPGLTSLKEATWRQRGYGDFWSHMLVAEGSVDIAVEPELAPYDIAALVPVVVEAGGRITALDGSPAVWGGSAVTTNGPLHEEVLGLLAGTVPSA